MKIKNAVLRLIESSSLGKRLIHDKYYRTVTFAVYSLIFNLLYAFYNGLLGLTSYSLIFVTSAVYYLLLGTMRFFAVISDRKNDIRAEKRASVTIGILLIALSIIFPFTVFLSMSKKAASVYGTITMITIATYTFTKITMAIITAVKHRKDNAIIFKAINNIRYAEVAVSLLTMQQSMLVSFGEVDIRTNNILNACTGAGVCIFIFILGTFTIKLRRKGQ